jgi:hypothetical protein
MVINPKLKTLNPNRIEAINSNDKIQISKYMI